MAEEDQGFVLVSAADAYRSSEGASFPPRMLCSPY